MGLYYTFQFVVYVSRKALSDDRRNDFNVFRRANGLPTSIVMVFARAVLQVGITWIVLIPSDSTLIRPSVVTKHALLSLINMMFCKASVGVNTALMNTGCGLLIVIRLIHETANPVGISR